MNHLHSLLLPLIVWRGWEKIVAEAMTRAKALAVNNVTEGEVGGGRAENSFKLTGLDISFEMPRI